MFPRSRFIAIRELWLDFEGSILDGGVLLHPCHSPIAALGLPRLAPLIGARVARNLGPITGTPLAFQPSRPSVTLGRHSSRNPFVNVSSRLLIMTASLRYAYGQQRTLYLSFRFLCIWPRRSLAPLARPLLRPTFTCMYVTPVVYKASVSRSQSSVDLFRILISVRSGPSRSAFGLASKNSTGEPSTSPSRC